jgi:carboxyl-terminal processing protease
MQHTPGAMPTPAQKDTAAAHASSAPKTQDVAWTKDQVKEAQQGLTKTGFYKGKINGSYDKSTKKAIKAYQEANKLPVTGHLDKDLLTRLHSS